ncbi:hypothetical protein JCM10213_003055, partial [Rhodosporidiobolus nylandii]
GIEARGRVPASVGFSGGSSGANPAPVGPKPQAAGFSRVNRPSPLNAPTGPRASFSSPPPPSASANFTPLGTPQFANVAPSFSPPPPNPGWGRSPAYSPFPQQQYSGGRAASFPPMNSPRSSPYGVPSPSPSPMKKRTANETASIRAKYSGLFLAPQFGGVCIYCGNAGHIHLQCPAPRLSCDPGPPKQVFVEGKPEPVCANANRSLCDYGQSGDGCPRLHVCSLCGSGDHFAPHCPFANGGGGGQSSSKFEHYLTKYGLINTPEAQEVIEIIKNGTRLGITTSPPERSVIYTNHIKEDDPRAHVVDEMVEEEEKADRMSEGFDLHVMSSVFGTIRTNPIGLAEKYTEPPAPQKHRVVEDASFPKNPQLSSIPSINSGIDLEDFPCSFLRLVQVLAYMRRAAINPQALVGGVDIAKAFHHLPLHSDVRRFLCLLWRGKIRVRFVAPFGLRSTPGVFILFMSLTIRLVLAHFGPGVEIARHMDDLSVAVHDPSIKLEDVIAFLEELGWTVEHSKTQPLARQTVHVGIAFDLDTQRMSVPERKKRKYTVKVDKILSTFGVGAVKYKDWASL